VVVYGAAANDLSLIFTKLPAAWPPWMLWQSEQATSFFLWAPADQNMNCRVPPWQVRHTPVFSAAVASLVVSTLVILFFIGS
jgi:hypothetical protein